MESSSIVPSLCALCGYGTALSIVLGVRIRQE